jgi:CelD/BcsL family acetyltransferase involved in cellulose biosynthesis
VTIHHPLTTSRAITSELQIERHGSVDAYLEREWDALADRCGAAPFLRPGWFEPWLRAFAPGGRPLLLAAREGGVLRGVLALVRTRAAVSGAANWHSPVYGALADGPDTLGVLAQGLLSEPAARTDLTMLEAGDPLVAELRTLSAAGGRGLIERTVQCEPYVDVAGSFDAYAASLARKQRKEIGRLRRRLEAEGEVSVQFEDGTERLDELLAEGLAIEGSGWKSELGTAILSSAETRRFYTDVARWAAARGWLRLAFLRLDGRPLAFDLCIEAEGAAYVLKGGFDQEYRRFGPGVLLTYESLARAFESDLATYEFLGGTAAYKLAWTDRTRDRARLQVFSRSPLGVAQLVAWRHMRPLVKRVAARR